MSVVHYLKSCYLQDGDGQTKKAIALETTMEQFDTVKMASGGLALVLEPSSTWNEFPAHAKKWKRRLNAKSLSKIVITFDECIAEVAIADGEFWITYDDFQSSIQLEAKNPRYNNIVTRLQGELRHDSDDATTF